MKRMLKNYGNWAEKHPVLATSTETLGIAAVKYGISYLGERLGVNLMNANPDVKEAHKKPLAETVLQFTLTAPLEEELLFRAAPNAVSDYLKSRGHDSLARRATKTADFLFAAAHSGLIVKNEAGHPELNFKISREDHALPVGPYIGAKNYQRLTRSRGLGHAMYAHSLNNALALAERHRSGRKK